jgi:hypothetical protein
MIEGFAPEDTQAKEELEALALEGLNSGASIPADEKYWQKRPRRPVERNS